MVCIQFQFFLFPDLSYPTLCTPVLLLLDRRCSLRVITGCDRSAVPASTFHIGSLFSFLFSLATAVSLPMDNCFALFGFSCTESSLKSASVLETSPPKGSWGYVVIICLSKIPYNRPYFTIRFDLVLLHFFLN